MSRSNKKPTFQKIESAACFEMAETLKALSHPVRLKVLLLLTDGPKCLSDLHLSCSACSQSQMSQFVSRMTLEGLLSAKRDGRKKLIEIADHRLILALRALVRIYEKKD